MRKLFFTLLWLMFLGGGGGWCAYSAESAEPAGRPATAAGIAPGKTITALGTVEPEEVAEVSAQVPGRIVNLGADPRASGKSIDYGSSVDPGAVLAEVDSQLYAARVERERAGCVRAEAELAQAMIHLERAEAQWGRAQDQKKKGIISDSEFDSARFDCRAAKAAVAVAQAALDQAKAALKQAEIELGRTAIRSPIKGMVIARRVSVGQTVAPASAPALFLVAKLDKLQVWASVNEADIAHIRPQQAVRFTVDAHPGKVFAGQVKQIRLDATVTQNVVTYTVVIAISGAAEGLLPYMTAHVEFQ